MPNRQDIVFEDLSKDAASLKKILDKALEAFNENKLGQYYLRVPKGTVLKINEIRDNDFAYLQDSVYKSNIAYILQQVDFQIWIYKLFRPEHSLENSFFYMLQTQLGIMVETLVAAILYNPFIASHADRSLGEVDSQYKDIAKAIEDMNFFSMLKLIEHLQILPKELTKNLHDIRRSRNEVHLQGRAERIYNSVNFEVFLKEYDLVRTTLIALTAYFQKHPIDKMERHSEEFLRNYFFKFTGDTEKTFKGSISFVDETNGFGFLRPWDAYSSLYFKKIDNQNFYRLAKYQKVRFTFFLSNEGLVCKDIEPV